jgi:transcription elongation factor Elf1
LRSATVTPTNVVVNHGLSEEDWKCPKCGGSSFGSCSSGTGEEYHFYSGPMRLTCNKCGHHFQRDFPAYKVKCDAH